MQLQKDISTVVLLAIFVLSCSAVPNPRGISISIHIDDLGQRTRGSIHTQEPSIVTLDFDDSDTPTNYSGLQWSQNLVVITDTIFARSPPNAILVHPASDTLTDILSFKTHPGSPGPSFSLHSLWISPTAVTLTWPPPQFTVIARALPVDGSAALVQTRTIGGVDGSRYPVSVQFTDIVGVNEVELYLASGPAGNPVSCAIDDILIEWEGEPKNSHHGIMGQAVL